MSGSPIGLGAAREDAEARVVVGVGLDPLREHLEPVELSRARGRDRRDALEPLLRDLLRRARGVVLRANGHLERAEELLALRDRLRVRDHLAQLVDLRAGEREQAVVDAHDRLADEMQAVPQEEVVRLVDAARLRVVERDEAGRDAPDLDCLEHLADRLVRAPLGVREDGRRALFRVRADLSLVRDDVHAAAA